MLTAITTMQFTRSQMLTSLLSVIPPKHLYHYTSPDGLIGIMKSKEMWATNTSYLNDSRELVEASEAAALSASNMARKPQYSVEEKALLAEMEHMAGAAGKNGETGDRRQEQGALGAPALLFHLPRKGRW